MPKNLKLYHKSACWMSLQAIHHTPVIKPENWRRALKHNGTSKTAEVQAIAFHAVNRNMVQTNFFVHGICESTQEGPQGEGNFSWKPQRAFFTSSKVAKDFSGESKSAFLPISSWHDDLGFQAVRIVSAERKTVAFGNKTGMWLPSWSTRWSWPRADPGQRVFTDTYIAGFTLCVCWISEMRRVTESMMK